MSILFDECLVALCSEVVVLSDEKSKEMYRIFDNKFNITFYGRIEWNLYKVCAELDVNTFENRYENQEENSYVL